MHPRLRLIGPALIALILSGCSTVMRVDSAVDSFARWHDAGPGAGTAVPAPPQRYRFERLPSQQQTPLAQAQTELERLAEGALARVGWRRAGDDERTPWTVQVAANSVQLPRAPWDDPWGPWGTWGPFGRDYVVTPSGQVIIFPGFPRYEAPYYQRAVSLVVRQAATGRVVYETRATHDGRWHGSPALWGAMLDAALQDFPQPPLGTRQVNVDVPR